MASLLKAFLALALLRARPQDLPASTALLGLSSGAYLGVGMLLASVSLPLGNALLAALLDALLLFAFAYAALNLKGKLIRFQQTLTALTGGLALIGLASLPVNAWLYATEVQGRPAELPSLLLLAVLVWNILLVAHVLRYALEVSLPLALLFSVAYMFVSLGILNALFVATG